MLAVVTEDFAFYHDMVRKLKRRGVSFVSLGLDDPIPPMVGAVLTTTAEEAVVDFSCVFPVERGPDVVGKGHTDVEVEAEVDGGSDERLEMALDRALAHLLGKGRIELLVVGVDPGKRPGLAVMGDAVL